MKILIVYPVDTLPSLKTSIDSISRNVANLTYHLSLIYDVSLFTADDLILPINKETLVKAFPQHTCLSNIKAIPKVLDKHLETNHYDLVICSWWYSPLSIYKVLKKHKINAFVLLNGSPLIGIPWPCGVLETLVASWKDTNKVKFVTGSKFQRGLFEKCGFNQITDTVYPSSPEYYKVITDYQDLHGVTIVSRIDPFKNIDLSIEAAGESGLPVTLVGYPDGANSEKYFTEVIEPLIYKYNVNYIGKLPFYDTLTVTAKSKCTVFSSMWEGCPYQPIESISVGTPVVCQKVGFMEEIISETTGVIVNTYRMNRKKRVKSMTEGILKAITLDRNKIIEEYKSRFIPEVQINHYLSLIKEFE